MKYFVNAIRFLTIIRVPRGLVPFLTDEKAYVKSIPFFPFVGLLLGLAGALAAWLAGFGLKGFAVSALACLVLTCLTGGLHLDGLADTADGFLSHKPREQMLEIMRDSRLGAMGGIAIGFDLVLKIALLTDLAPAQRLVVLVLMPVVGRSMIVLMLSLLKYARSSGGLGGAFADFPRLPILAWTGLVCCLLAFFLGKLPALAGLGAAAVATAVLALICYRRIGGMTGDTLGAASEISEIVFLAAAVWLL